jgi:hypothetical protein
VTPPAQKPFPRLLAAHGRAILARRGNADGRGANWQVQGERITNGFELGLVDLGERPPVHKSKVAKLTEITDVDLYKQIDCFYWIYYNR